MKIKGIVLLLTWMILHFSTGLKAGPAPVNSNIKTIEEAIDAAAREGKLILVDFSAAWCSPCRWMEKTTFNDGEVKKMIQAHFIHLRADIDDKDGFALKNFYKVKYLPTILIINASGQMMERIEETITPGVMKSILQKHIHQPVLAAVRHKPNTPPNSIPGSMDNIIISDEAPDPLISPDDFIRYFQHHPGRKTFKILTGTYSDHHKALEHVNVLRAKFREPVNVLNEIQDGKVIFKVCLGQFFDPAEAAQFKNLVSSRLEHECRVI
jgi:thioredoxin-related protein